MAATSIALWDWTVAAYGRTGVSEACLDLQDTGGQSVCLLLWAGWSAQMGRPLDAETLDEAVDTARAWHDTAVDPLREVRRRLKRPHPDLAPDDREAVRDLVKAAELLAERCLLLALEALTPAPTQSPSAPLENLLAVSRQWSATVPRSALTTLAERLSA